MLYNFQGLSSIIQTLIKESISLFVFVNNAYNSGWRYRCKKHNLTGFWIGTNTYNCSVIQIICI